MPLPALSKRPAAALPPSSRGLSKEEKQRAASAFLDAERARINAVFLHDRQAPKATQAFSAMVDTLLAWLAEDAALEKRGIALIATGGYGRRDLFPHSDIDVLLLHENAAAADVQHAAEPLLYVLWDAGFKVGHAVRSLKETASLLGDVTTLTSLLDARRVAGAQAVFDKLQALLAEHRKAGNVTAFVAAKMQERDARHVRGGDSRYLLEPNIKEGKGGLRDLHTLYWIARYVYGISDLHELTLLGKLSEAEYRQFRRAEQFLSAIRFYLHMLSGRAEERLTFDMQRRVAEALGYRGKTSNEVVERFMKHYFRVARDVGYLTRIFCAALEEEQKYIPRFAFSRLWTGKKTLEDFTVTGNRLQIESAAQLKKNPLLFLSLFYTAAHHRLDIHPATLTMLARHLTSIDRKLRDDKAANDLFLTILCDNVHGEATLRAMKEAGVLGRFIPEFAHTIGQMQFDMYHIYTTDEHILTALGILHGIEQGKYKVTFPLATQVMPLIESRRVLYFAVLCHDIAKGKGQHEARGAKIAEALAARFGFTAKERETIAWLVLHQELFSESAFKRDLSDPATIERFGFEVQSLEKLRLLFVLTVADIRAVGPNVWNAWKGALMRELYARCEYYLRTGSPLLPGDGVEEGFRALLAAELADWSAERLDVYLAQGTPDFWASRTPKEHAVIARMLAEAEAKQKSHAFHLDSDAFKAVTELAVTAPDRRGLLADVAGALSLSGINILGARIFTLKNGWAVQLWQLQDINRKALDIPSVEPQLAHHLRRMFSGASDVAAEIAKQRPAYPSRKASFAVTGQVFFETEHSAAATIVEVNALDSLGLLHAICRALQQQQLNITSAHINTYGEKAVDVFYVKDNYGMKIVREERLERIRQAILDAISG